MAQNNYRAELLLAGSGAPATIWVLDQDLIATLPPVWRSANVAMYSPS